MTLDPTAFKSGRTKPQSGRPYVLEGNRLYVTPLRHAYMGEEINRPGPPSNNHVNVYRTLLAAGMESGEAAQVFQNRSGGLFVIVDREMEEVV